MFEELVTAAEGASGDEAIGAWAKVQAAACARRLAAMVELLDRCHAAAGSAEREQWYLDNWGAVSAAAAAAQSITTGAASSQLVVASALRDRLPRVAQRFAGGTVSFEVVKAIVWRTGLITDSVALALVDEALAGAVAEWEPMSAIEIERAIDCWVNRHDPDARDEQYPHETVVRTGVPMPRRTATRAQDRARRAEGQRRHNGLVPHELVCTGPAAPGRRTDSDRSRGPVRPRGPQPTTEVTVCRPSGESSGSSPGIG